MECCALIERRGVEDYYEDCNRTAKFIVNEKPYCGLHLKSFKAWERRMKKLGFPYIPFEIKIIDKDIK